MTLNVSMSHGLLADIVSIRVQLVYYRSCTTDAAFSEVYDK